VGVALFFIEAALPSSWFEHSSVFLFSCDIAVYALAGLILGFIWPNVGWGLGLCLFAVWPPVLLFAVFLAGEVPWNVRAELGSLFGYCLILIAACIGGWVGSVIGRHVKNNTSARNGQALPNP
jgi:hypothetical protein